MSARITTTRRGRRQSASTVRKRFSLPLPPVDYNAAINLFKDVTGSFVHNRSVKTDCVPMP